MFVHPPSKQTRPTRAADATGMRAHNATLLLRMVWDDVEGVSRADLSRMSGLSRSTVSAIVADLIERGLVVESHVARSSGGRPPIVLRFAERHRSILGIDLGASHLSAVLTDLRGQVQARITREFDVQGDPAGTLEALADMLVTLRQEAGHPPILGVGIGVPCPVDAASHDRLSPRILPMWIDVRLADWLYRRLDLPIFVENDANCGALAEAWWGAGQGLRDFTYIKIGTGVGSGQHMGGDLYRGSAGIAGEIGHTTVNPNGRRCRCGLTGCLEAEIGSGAIVDKAREALAKGRASTLSDVEPLRLVDIVQAARDKDALALDLIEEAGEHLGVAVANLLNLLNPARVVLGGRLAAAGDLLLTPLRRTVRDRALWTAIERADVVPVALGEDHVAVGAATLVLKSALDDPALFQGTLHQGSHWDPRAPVS